MEALTKYDFTATEKDELSFAKDTTIRIINTEEDENWFKAESGGKIGVVPRNYLDIKPHPWFFGTISRSDAEQELMKKSNNTWVHEDGAFLIRLSVRAPGEFSLSVKFRSKVQHFRVLRDGAGKYFLWTEKFSSLNKLVEHHRNYSVSPLEKICLKDMASEGGEPAFQAPKMRAVALYDFTPQADDELGLKKGDVIEVIDTSHPDWWVGDIRGGNETLRGSFPKTYVQVQE